MSCFIVPTDTIDRIISTIELQGGWTRHACGLPVAYLYDWNALGRAMLAMNTQAFKARYEGRHAESIPDDIDVYRWDGRHVPLIEGYKSLRCFLYQCREGEVPGEPLYEALEAYADALAIKIAEVTPGYRSAAWA